MYRFHKPLGGSWGPWTLYAAGPYDGSVSVRWPQFFERFPQTIGIAHQDTYDLPNQARVGVN